MIVKLLSIEVIYIWDIIHESMRLLILFTFLMAILFVEVAAPIMMCGESLSVDFEMPSEESSDSDNNEENQDDTVEKDKFFEVSTEQFFYATSYAKGRPQGNKVLLFQPLVEIHFPPPNIS